MRARSVATIGVVTVALFASRNVAAHRLDECLQAARIAIEGDHLSLELDITPGAAVADSLIAEIDGDRDGRLSEREQRDYARHVLRSIDLAADTQPLALTEAALTVPDVAPLQRGEGVIQLRARVPLPAQGVGAHHLTFRNRYRPDISVYLANALVPDSPRVAVTGQRREAQQRDLAIAYELRAGRQVPWGWVFGGVAFAAVSLRVLRK